MSRDNKTNILALFCYRSLLKDWVIGRAQKLGTGCRTLYRGESEAGRLRAWSLLSTAAPVQAVGVWHGRGDHDLSPRVHRHAWGRPESRAQVVAGVPTLPRSPQGPLIHEIVQITRHGRVRGVGDTIVLISTHPAATYLQGPRGSEYRRDDTATELDSLGNIVAKTRWYVYDGLGPVVGEVDPLGNLTSSPKYDGYGVVRANTRVVPGPPPRCSPGNDSLENGTHREETSRSSFRPRCSVCVGRIYAASQRKRYPD